MSAGLHATAEVGVRRTRLAAEDRNGSNADESDKRNEKCVFDEARPGFSTLDLGPEVPGTAYRL